MNKTSERACAHASVRRSPPTAEHAIVICKTRVKEGGEGHVEGGGRVRAKIFKARVTGGGEGYVELDRLGPRSSMCKERPRLAARACAQQQPFTRRFREAWPRPQLMNLRREEKDPIRREAIGYGAGANNSQPRVILLANRHRLYTV